MNKKNTQILQHICRHIIIPAALCQTISTHWDYSIQNALPDCWRDVNITMLQKCVQLLFLATPFILLKKLTVRFSNFGDIVS